MRISDWSSDVCSSDLRVEIGDGERPGNYRARARPAARAHRNIIVLCPFDEVSNDEEITGKAHLNDDVEFEIQPVEIGLSLFLILDIELRQPFFETGNRISAKLPFLPFPIDRKSVVEGKSVPVRVNLGVRR